MNFLLVYVLLITLFYTIYFLKQISLKKQKIDTNRLGKGSKPKNVVVIERSLLLLTFISIFKCFTFSFYDTTIKCYHN